MKTSCVTLSFKRKAEDQKANIINVVDSPGHAGKKFIVFK